VIIIGITGSFGSGKGTVVEYLVSQKGFTHYSVSKFLTEKIVRRGKTVDRNEMTKIANEIRTKNGPDYIVKKLFKKAVSENKNVVIESIRNPEEARFIKNNGGYLFSVDANQKTRYQRIKLRASEKDSVSFREFKLQEKKESNSTNPNAQNLSICMAMADFKIQNNLSINNLTKKVEKIIKYISD